MCAAHSVCVVPCYRIMHIQRDVIRDVFPQVCFTGNSSAKVSSLIGRSKADYFPHLAVCCQSLHQGGRPGIFLGLPNLCSESTCLLANSLPGTILQSPPLDKYLPVLPLRCLSLMDLTMSGNHLISIHLGPCLPQD